MKMFWKSVPTTVRTTSPCERGDINALILTPSRHFEESNRSLNEVNRLIRAQWLLHQTIITRNVSLALGPAGQFFLQKYIHLFSCLC